MVFVILISLIVAFLATFFATRFLIKFLLNAGIVGIDQHKKDKPKLPSSGGMCVSIGILAGLLTYIGLTTFLYGVSNEVLYLFAIISSVLIVTLVGLFDDLNVRSKMTKSKNEMDIRVGLPQWLKPILTLPGAIPLMVVSAGVSTMSLPFIGAVDFGIIYPLLLIPIGVVGASNAINMLGGFNGSETGMGIVYMAALALFALMSQNSIAPLFLIVTVSLIAFVFYNWFPAKILPGDSLTYLLGALVVSGIIVGNMEKLGILLLLPFIVEFFLKLRSGFKASCLGKIRADGKLNPPYGKKIYSLTHFFMILKPMTEKQVALSLILLQVVVSIVALFLVYFRYV
ncbi:MAG: hypothetical protein HYS62_00975 [Candidatus Aenigmarchaeota archaeon]|nr:hypothetical protein [Candidatus Aenigmarchaeota archaeon]